MWLFFSNNPIDNNYYGKWDPQAIVDRAVRAGLHYVELRTAYDWDPVTYLNGVTEQGVVGVEAPLWTETVSNITAAHYMVMPRLPAIAEVGWSPASERDWESFRRRIAAHAPRWRLLGVNYYPSAQVNW